MKFFSFYHHEILSFITSHPNGATRKVIVEQFGEPAGEATRELLMNKLVLRTEVSPEEYDSEGNMIKLPSAVYSVTKQGQLALKTVSFNQTLTKKECWKERAYGFFACVLIAVIAGVILYSLGLT